MSLYQSLEPVTMSGYMAKGKNVVEGIEVVNPLTLNGEIIWLLWWVQCYRQVLKKMNKGIRREGQSDMMSEGPDLLFLTLVMKKEGPKPRDVCGF